jgi:L-threonylcarbamoyladenylate synthase
LNKFNTAEEAINWLKQGKILLHPTEGVWGIGCDAFNAAAVNKINVLKQRESSKSLIVLAPTIHDSLRYFQPLSEIKINFIETIWPGHTTVIYESNSLVPFHIKALDNSIAMRVSDHKPIKELLVKFKSLMVSTSANISNQPIPITAAEAIEIFPEPDVALYDFGNGTAKKPSAIIDLKTMDYIRE